MEFPSQFLLIEHIKDHRESLMVILVSQIEFLQQKYKLTIVIFVEDLVIVFLQNNL